MSDDVRKHFPPVLLLVALCGLLYFNGARATGFTGTDELRYSKIAKELSPGRDFFLLHFNGERYSDKPPPYFWMVGLSFELFGFSPLAARVPGILAAMSCVALVYAIAFLLFGRSAVAFLAAMTLMLMPRFAWIARWVRLDLVMCAFVYASMFCFARNYFGGKPRLAGWWFWIFLGLSFAIKGPAGPVVILGGALTFLFWQGERKRWRDLVHWGGIAAAVAINAAWILPIVFLGDAESSSDMIVRQNIGRIIDPWRHQQPPWYFAKNLWYDAFPAMFFLASGSIFWFLRRKRPEADGDDSGSGPFGEHRSACRFLIAWFAFTVFFFSLYPPKRAQYLLPMYPAVAIFAAYFVDLVGRKLEGAGLQTKKLFRYTIVPTLINALPIVLLMPVMVWRNELAEWATGILDGIDIETSESLRAANADFEYGGPALSRGVQALATFSMVAVAAGFVFVFVRRRVVAGYGLLLGTAYGALFCFFGWFVPPSAPDDDLKAFAEMAAARIAERPGLVIAMYGDDKPLFNIYGDFPIVYFDDDFEDEFAEFATEAYETGRPFMLIMEKGDERDFRREPWAGKLARSDYSMRGDEIVVFESSSAP